MKTFRTRILVLLLVLVATTQLATVAALVMFTQREAFSRAQDDLQSGGKVFSRIMQSRAAQWSNAVQVLVADYGFKEAVTTREQGTILSVLENSARRINADLAAFLDMEGAVLASTKPLSGAAVSLGSIQDVSGSDILYRTIDGKPYLLVVAPVHAPAPVGWAAIGFRIDSRLAQEMHQLLGVHVTYFDAADGAGAFVSTLSPALQTALHGRLARRGDSGVTPYRMELAGETYVTLEQPVEGSDGRLHVLLQTSLQDILAAFSDLRSAILIIALLGLLLALPIASRLARGASRPLDNLVTAARRIEGGNYSEPVEPDPTREFGALARTLNSMQERVGERERRIRFQATHDDLTGLPNRVLFRETLEAAIETAQRDTAPLALLVLDMRELERINASFGHLFGSHVLQETARLLVSRMRNDAMVARTDASRFMILLPGEDEMRARLLAGLLIDEVRSGVVHEEVPVGMGAQVGICVYPQHGTDADSLLRRAETSLYDARQANTDVMVYQPGRDEGHRRQLSILGDLARAVAGSSLESGELELYYQPKVDMKTQRVQSLEALVRWNHPRHGRISPGEFIPLAEQAGSIAVLTRWVLKIVHQQMAAWHEQGLQLDIAVNLSAGDLTDPHLSELLRELLQTTRVPPGHLVLEITESAVMRDPARAVEVMEELRRLSLRFSIDDFGTGYSSLAQLKRLPVDEVKIDKSFVLDLKPGSDDALIVRSTIDLGHNLGMKVVAEGVESGQSWRQLLEMGCDSAQGYFISQPLPAREIPDWVRALNAKLQSADSPTQQVRVLREHRQSST